MVPNDKIMIFFKFPDKTKGWAALACPKKSINGYEIGYSPHIRIF